MVEASDTQKRKRFQVGCLYLVMLLLGAHSQSLIAFASSGRVLPQIDLLFGIMAVGLFVAVPMCLIGYGLRRVIERWAPKVARSNALEMSVILLLLFASFTVQKPGRTQVLKSFFGEKAPDEVKIEAWAYLRGVGLARLYIQTSLPASVWESACKSNGLKQVRSESSDINNHTIFLRDWTGLDVDIPPDAEHYVGEAGESATEHRVSAHWSPGEGRAFIFSTR